MKFQILQLDPTDDQVSIRDKLTRVKAERVLLVWPRRGEPITNRLDLVLVQRKARDLGIQLGVLSHDPRVIDAARKIDVPLFDSVEQASQRRWPDPAGISFPKRPEAARNKARLETAIDSSGDPSSTTGLAAWLRYSLFGLAILALLALVATLAPSATLVVQPETSTEQLNSTVWVQLGDESQDSNRPSIQGRLVATTVTASGRTETTGRSRVPAEQSTGQLLFTNLTQEPVTIPAGTSVRATEIEGIRFVTTEAANLDGQQGSTVLVPAQAAQAGPQGNVEADSINAVDGALGLEVQVTNPDPFEGGSNRTQSIVADRDLQRLRLELEQEVQSQALDRLQELLPTTEALLEPSLRIDEIIQLDYDAQADQPAGSLGLTITAEVSATAYSIEDLQQAIEAQIPFASNANLQPLPGSMSILERQGLTSGSRLGVGVSAEWTAYQPIDAFAVRRWLVGEPVDKSLEPLQEQQDFELIEARLWPEWSPIYPILHNKITVRYPWQVE